MEKKPTSSNNPVDFACKLCKGLLNEPILTGCCGTSYCRHCIQSTSPDNICPHCKSPQLSYVDDHRIERQMKQVAITCCHHDRGCLWLGTPNELKEHLANKDGCDFVAIKCPKKCGSTVERKFLEEHLAANCYISWTECAHCGETLPTDSIGTHVDSECPDYQLPCPNNCGMDIKRSQVSLHRETCPKELMACSFKEGGCSELARRDEMDGHLRENSIQHSLIAFGHLNEEMKKMKKDLQESQEISHSQSEMIHSLSKRLAEAEKEVTTIKNKTLMIASTLMEELEYISGQPHTSQAKTLALASMRDQLSILVNPLLLKLYPTGTNLTFRLPMFSKLKAADQLWCSQPFVVHNGYQMCIVVHPNGEGEGRNTHISVCLHLIAGSYDDELKWPLNFTNEVVVSLMRQVPDLKSPPRGAKSKLNIFEQNFVQQQRMRTLVHILHRVNKPLGELGLAFGYIGLFCAQNNIDSTALYNDSLVFQLSMLPS